MLHGLDRTLTFRSVHGTYMLGSLLRRPSDDHLRPHGLVMTGILEGLRSMGDSVPLTLCPMDAQTGR